MELEITEDAGRNIIVTKSSNSTTEYRLIVAGVGIWLLNNENKAKHLSV